MLSLNEARRVIRAAEEKAHELGCAVNIAVVDESGHLVAQVRMTGAWIAGIDAAASKAYTARAFDMPTSELISSGVYNQDTGARTGTFGRRMPVAAGGVPLRAHGEVCGAVGVSGAASSEDDVIARAGARALSDGASAGGYLNGARDEIGGTPRSSQIARLGQRGLYGHSYQYAQLQ